VSAERAESVLDVVIEGLPPPDPQLDIEAVWPAALIAAWRPEELKSEDELRLWRISDPQGDLQVEIGWHPSYEDGKGALLFSHVPRPATRSEDLLRVCELGLRMAEQLGLKLYDPVLDEDFECEDWAYRLTEPFHVRGYLATHYVRPAEGRPSWLHTHGMARFGLPDIEAFRVGEDDTDDVVAFVHEIAETWLHEDPPALGAQTRRVDGVKVRFVDSKDERPGIEGFDESTWEGHETPYVTLSPKAQWDEALSGWRPVSVRRSPVLVDRLCAITSEILPEVKKRFQKGDATVKVKARFPVFSPSTSKDFESMWIHVDEWEDGKIRGRLANEPERRSDLACGSPVEIPSGEVWDVLVVQGGQGYRGVSLRRWLRH
jgi:hypothetical protein